MPVHFVKNGKELMNQKKWENWHPINAAAPLLRGTSARMGITQIIKCWWFALSPLSAYQNQIMDFTDNYRSTDINLLRFIHKHYKALKTVEQINLDVFLVSVVARPWMLKAYMGTSRAQKREDMPAYFEGKCQKIFWFAGCYAAMLARCLRNCKEIIIFMIYDAFIFAYGKAVSLNNKDNRKYIVRTEWSYSFFAA